VRATAIAIAHPTGPEPTMPTDEKAMPRLSLARRSPFNDPRVTSR
jgi:hypothetical protein